MPFTIRVKWQVSGLFFKFGVILTSEGYLLKITFKDSQSAPDGVATLKVRKGAFDALNKGSGALGKVK